MTVLVNASNLVVGGGVQVGVWFVRQCLMRQLDCFFALSEKVYDELCLSAQEIPEEQVAVFKHSPSRDKTARARLQHLQREKHCERVFTVFGPAYCEFEGVHISGFADGWVSHATWRVYRKVFGYNLLAWLKMWATCVYKAWHMRKADAWIFEADVAADGLASRVGLDNKACHVVPNNCAVGFVREPEASHTHSRPFNILYFTADYAHKGIDNLVGYAKALQSQYPDFDFCFTVTIDPASATATRMRQAMGEQAFASCFRLTGYINTQDAPALIDQADTVIQMSYLETFSANYPEAMVRGRPLVVSDFGFARDICKDAALYADPDNSQQVADALFNVYQDREATAARIKRGREVQQALPDSQQRFNQIWQVIHTAKQGVSH